MRCHYGIASLAAMAWRSLPVLEHAAEILGAPSGYTKTGYLVGVGPPNIGALRANVAMQQVPRHRQSSSSATTRPTRLWPAARLDDFAEFAYEPHGGYGDGHQTALAFAHAARRGGGRLRQHTTVHALDVTAEQVPACVLADGGRIGAAHVVLAAGPWSVQLAAGVGIDLPVRAQRAQILLVDPGRPLGPLPVFSDLVSLQYVRTEGAGQILLGDRDHSDPEWSDPDDYRERVNDDELATVDPQVRAPLPRPSTGPPWRPPTPVATT